MLRTAVFGVVSAALAACTGASQMAGGPAAGPSLNSAPMGKGTNNNFLALVSLEDVDSEAVCNDGSPAGYYFQESPSGSNAPWLIFLMGGDWCYNQESCQERMQATAFQVSSDGWKKTSQLGGVMSSSNNNPFAGYNKWMGDVGASPATFGMNFRGQRIISATLTSISESKGLTSGADVIFGGCSAGARGAMVTLDNVASMLPTGVRVRGLLDSGLWLDETPLDPTAQLSLQEQTQMAQQLYVAQSVIPAGCASAYPGEEWHCIYGQYRMPFVKTSYFINSAQFDSFQMIFDMGGNVPHTGGQVMYANAYQQATQAEMKTLVGGSNGVFSTSCLAHCLTQDTAYLSSYNANGQSFAQAITEWLNGGSPVDISQCQGYANCVVQCPGGSSILDIQEATADSTPAVQEREIEGQEEHAERAEVEEAGGATTGAGMPAGEQPQGQGGAASWPYQSTQQSGNGNSWMQQGRHRKLLGEGESAALLML